MSTSCSPAPRSNRFTVAKLLAAAVGALTVLSFAPVLQAQPSPEAERSTSRSLINQARASAGLSSLAVHAGADAMAQEHAQRMADRDAIYHNPNLGPDADAHGVDWKTIGENVGVGSSAQMVHEAFMNSPDHYVNISHSEYTILGVGAVRGKDGSIFIAHVFAALRSPSPSSIDSAAPQAPRPIVPVAPSDAVSPARSQPVPSATAPAATAPVVPPLLNAVEGGVVDTQVVFG